jgi:WD40 repeat protein
MALDENFLFTGSDDKTIRYWDLNSRMSLAVLRGHESSIRDLYLIAESGSLVSCGHDGCVKVWKYQTQSVVKEITRACGLNCLSFLPDSNMLLVGTEESTIITIPLEPCFGNPVGVDNTLNKVQVHMDKKRRQLRGEDVTFSDDTRSIRSEDLEEPFPDPVEEFLRDTLVSGRKA